AWIYVNTNTDKWPLRLLVGALVLLDLTTTCLNAQILHNYLVSNFGNVLNTTVISKTVIAEFFITLAIVLSVEVFFASRVWMIGKFHWIVPASIVGAGIASMISELENSSVANFSGHRQKLQVGWNCSLAAVSDIISTVSLLWTFSSFKNGIKQTPFHYSLGKVYLITMSKFFLNFIFLPSIHCYTCHKLQLQCSMQEMFEEIMLQSTL
ncbi:hypothetical protein K435DRAFT_706855, partial [Dendrothele bispora CBS 962.96]